MMLKNLELLKDVAPRAARVALLVNPSNPGVAPTMADLQRAAPALGIRLIQVDVRTLEDFERAFATIDGILVTPEQLIFSQRHRIAAFAEKHRLPSAYASLHFIDAGGLMAMAPTTAGVSARLASYILKTAKALGLTIPQSLLLRADQVIE